MQHIVRRLLRNTLKSIRRTRCFISDSHNIPEGFTLFLEIKYTSINSAKGWDIFFEKSQKIRNILNVQIRCQKNRAGQGAPS